MENEDDIMKVIDYLITRIMDETAYRAAMVHANELIFRGNKGDLELYGGYRQWVEALKKDLMQSMLISFEDGNQGYAARMQSIVDKLKDDGEI